MIDIKKVNLDDEQFIHQIFPGEGGKFWVNFNWYWLEISRRRADIHSRYIFSDDGSPMGFVAYGQHYSDRQLKESVSGSFELYHMVIDSSHQSRGLGRSSTIHVIQEIARNQECKHILVACHPDNKTATNLYKSLGFYEVGKNYDNDPLYALSPGEALKLIVTNQGHRDFNSRDGALQWQHESIQSAKEFDWEAWENGLEV
jgi:ribosomal protein S18 acetylase RimI-like enzyme